MEHTTVESSALVLDPTALHFHKKSSHGFSRQVCSGLEGCCWVSSCSFYYHSHIELPLHDRDHHEQVPHQLCISAHLLP